MFCGIRSRVRRFEVVALVIVLAFTIWSLGVDIRGTERTLLGKPSKSSSSVFRGTEWISAESGDNPVDRKSSVKVLILGYYRSGSTLTVETLSHFNNSFYVFEPLHAMEMFLLKVKAPLRFLNGTRGSPLLPGYELPYKINMMKSLFLCEMNNIDILTLTMGFGPKFTKQLAQFVECRRAPQPMCLVQLTDSCKTAPVRVIKTIRFSIKTVEKILKSVPDLKVIHLIRDPRGLFYSQRRASDTKYSFLQQSICNTLHSDLEFRKVLEKKYPHTFMEVIYEDLAQNPDELLRNIYKFIGLDLPDNVREWLRMSTSSGLIGTGILNTTRSNSTETAYIWTKYVSWPIINYFQMACGDLLKHGNFPIIKSPEDLKNFVIPRRQTIYTKN